jgi:hypothetical protein
LNFDSRVARQTGYGDSGAGMASGLAEQLDEKIRRSIYKRGTLTVRGNRVNVAIDGDELVNGIECACYRSYCSESIERADSGCQIAIIQIAFFAQLTGPSFSSGGETYNAREEKHIAISQMGYRGITGLGRLCQFDFKFF